MLLILIYVAFFPELTSLNVAMFLPLYCFENKFFPPFFQISRRQQSRSRESARYKKTRGWEISVHSKSRQNEVKTRNRKHSLKKRGAKQNNEYVKRKHLARLK